MKLILLTVLLCQIICLYSNVAASENESTGSFVSDRNSFDKLPTILIVTLFRNKAHTLPYYFNYLDRLQYPKERIALW